MGQQEPGINMFDTSVFAIRVRGKLGDSWSEYFSAKSMSVEEGEAGLSSTTLITEPVDQAGLIGIINSLNGLGLPVLSVECLTAPTEDEPPERDGA